MYPPKAQCIEIDIHKPSQRCCCSLLLCTFSPPPGIRLLGGLVTDAMEAMALSFNPDVIHVYVCSWGPPDNGSVLGGPGLLTQLALQSGAHKASSLLM